MPEENTLKELRFILDKCSRNFNHDGSALWTCGEAKDNGNEKTSSGPLEAAQTLTQEPSGSF